MRVLVSLRAQGRSHRTKFRVFTGKALKPDGELGHGTGLCVWGMETIPTADDTSGEGRGQGAVRTAVPEMPDRDERACLTLAFLIGWEAS
jgi:hypothetical protein